MNKRHRTALQRRLQDRRRQAEQKLAAQEAESLVQWAELYRCRECRQRRLLLLPIVLLTGGGIAFTLAFIVWRFT